jgi:hypothetical protein
LGVIDLIFLASLIRTDQKIFPTVNVQLALFISYIGLEFCYGYVFLKRTKARFDLSVDVVIAGFSL